MTRLSIHRLLPIFSWTRQRQAPSSRGHHFLQVEPVMPPPPKEFSTELILFQDKNNPHHHELSYTSLRDLLATNARHVHPIRELAEFKELEDDRPAIKNRLVELAARAYLLPTHVQTTPANQFFSRQWAKFTNRHSHPSNLTNRHSHHSNLTLQTNTSCLHWVDITRAFCSLFKLTHLRPQPVLRL